MLDFMTIATKTNKKSCITEIYPKFIMRKSNDLMIRGRDFYAIWDDDRKMWSTDEDDATRLIDNELRKYAQIHENELEGTIIIRGIRIVELLINFISIVKSRCEIHITNWMGSLYLQIPNCLVKVMQVRSFLIL